jgi:hypothetical protein
MNRLLSAEAVFVFILAVAVSLLLVALSYLFP